MQSERKERRTLLILYVLAAYIFFQVCWWGYSLAMAHYHHIVSVHPNEVDQQELFKKKIWMIAGEGGVFLILLLLGFWYIKKTIIRELRLARREKTFLLSVTHELKTPVAAIRLFLETLKTRKLDEQQSQQIVQDALKETERLQNMSENILLASRFDHHDDGTINENFDLSELLVKLTARFNRISGNRIEAQIMPDIIIKGDKELLRALFYNLVENALKYSGVSGKVVIFLKSTEDHIVAEIADNGPGIPDEEKKLVFGKFYRSGDEQTRKYKGTGLGLYIAQNVARMHSAKIEIKDNAPAGSIFAVSFIK
jgi:two-component system phosphate regulon sensor histidine kinase PhoR